MKFLNIILIIFLLIAVSGCHMASSHSNMKTWRTYPINIEHFFVELQIPPELEQGYAKFDTDVPFETPPDPLFTFSFGNGIYKKIIGSLSLGADRNFNKCDIVVFIFALKCDTGLHPMRSAEDLVEFSKNILSEEYILVDGTKASDLGDIRIEKIGNRDVVIATRADPYRDRTIKLKDTKGRITNLEQSLSPFQQYYVRLDDEITIGIEVFYERKRTLNPKWYAASHARISKIIEKMKIEKRTK